MSVAKGLIAGHILEDQIFPYPQLRDKGQEVLRMRRLTQATGVGRDKILSSMPQLLTEPAGIYEDEEMNNLAGFILDKGSYPWDVVS